MRDSYQKLVSVEMAAQRAGDLAKTFLTKHGIVEQPLDENHLGEWLKPASRHATTLGAGEESMGEGGSDTEIDDGPPWQHGKTTRR